jgi:hypothetical protein
VPPAKNVKMLFEYCACHVALLKMTCYSEICILSSKRHEAFYYGKNYMFKAACLSVSTYNTYEGLSVEM